LELVR
jgi:hypothetical protein